MGVGGGLREAAGRSEHRAGGFGDGALLRLHLRLHGSAGCHPEPEHQSHAALPGGEKSESLTCLKVGCGQEGPHGLRLSDEATATCVLSAQTWSPPGRQRRSSRGKLARLTLEEGEGRP